MAINPVTRQRASNGPAHEFAVEVRNSQRGRAARIEKASSWLRISDPYDRLMVLDARLGRGVGARRERERLLAEVRSDVELAGLLDAPNPEEWGMRFDKLVGSLVDGEDTY